MATGAIFSDDIARRVRAMLEEWERERGRSPRPTPRRRLQPSGGQVELCQLDLYDGHRNEDRRIILPGQVRYWCKKIRYYDFTDDSIAFGYPGGEAFEVYTYFLTGAYLPEDAVPIVKIQGRYFAIGGGPLRFILKSSLVLGGTANAAGYYGHVPPLSEDLQQFTLRDTGRLVSSTTSLPVGTIGIAIATLGGLDAEYHDWIAINAGCV